MTLMKVEGVSNDVFIPEEISTVDQEFLIERTENIVRIVGKAKVDIGIELLQVETRFRNHKAFGGQKGWYHKWLKSVNISTSARSSFVNCALISMGHNHDPSLLEEIPSSVTRALNPPTIHGANKGIGGACHELIDYTVDSYDSSPESRVDAVKREDLSAAKNSLANQILSAEQCLEDSIDSLTKATKARKDGPSWSKDQKTWHLLDQRKQVASKTVDEVEKRYEKLIERESELRDKYKDWRSPEAIKQEFDEAIEKARAEERAKKAENEDDSTQVKAMKDLHLKEVQENQRLSEELAQLRAQVNSTEEASDSLDNQLSKLKVEKQKEIDKLKNTVNRQRSELENFESMHPFECTTPMIRQGVLMAKINEFRESAIGFGLFLFNDKDQANFDELKDAYVTEAMLGISEWLQFLEPEMRDEIGKLVNALGNTPAQSIQTTKLNTIND